MARVMDEKVFWVQQLLKNMCSLMRGAERSDMVEKIGRRGGMTYAYADRIEHQQNKLAALVRAAAPAASG
jgi:hypothetical protein